MILELKSNSYDSKMCYDILGGKQINDDFDKKLQIKNSFLNDVYIFEEFSLYDSNL